MAMGPKYRIFATIDSDVRQVFPSYGDKTSLIYTLEKDQQLFRTSLDGEFKFLKGDFDFIMSKPFDSTVYIMIERSVDNGHTYSSYFEGKFVRTDCTINEVDKILKTSISPIDGYENIISGLDKEFNLIELAPDMQELSLYKRPAIQIYVAGDDVITTIVGGTYFEQDAVSVTDANELKEKYFFGILYNRELIVEDDDLPETPVNDEILGVYAATKIQPHEDISHGSTTEEFINIKNPEIVIKVTKYITDKTNDILVECLNITTGEILAHSAITSPEDGVIILANTNTDIYERYKCTIVNNAVASRLLVDNENFNPDSGEILNPISPEDLAKNSNYSYCVPLNLLRNLVISNNFSEKPTEWGQYQPGLYYEKPSVEYTKQFYPVNRSTWLANSLWYTPYGPENFIDARGAKKYQLRHSYTLSGCIKVLLAKIAPELTFGESSLYSRFFYERVNPISSDAFRLFITPISNVLKGEYDKPAQKATITLRNIFDMLRDCFRCYWFVDRGRLRIEHISFFRNGLNYLTLADAGIDISDIIEPKTKRAWTTAANSYYFDKLNIPEYIQFKWADSVTKPFEGYPIEVLSNFTEKGNIEEVNVSKFSSDVDLMLLNPDAFSNDNFAVLAATLINGEYEVPFVELTVDSYFYRLQNGLLAFADLQPKYYTKDLPAKSVKINNQELSFDSNVVRRNKLQEVKFPVGISFLNPMQLIKTKIGDGLADSIKINLSSQIAQATLRYDNE